MDNQPSRDDWIRTGRIVRESREMLGLNQSDIEGVSTSSINKIEAGIAANYRGQTISAIERALKWGRGSFREVLAGGDPIPAAPIQSPEDRITRLESKVDQILELLERRGH